MIESAMIGIVHLNKPHGASSRAAVDAVKRLVRPIKVGHAGTLDPLATGVLVVAVGRATRLIDRIQEMPKRYVGTFILGVTSPTEDTESEPEPLADGIIPTREQIEAVLPKFTGEVWQTPPKYSAIKVDGRRAYKLARKGHEFELDARPIRVDCVSIVAYEAPRVTLDILCGAGTYVRTLGRDIAKAVGSDCVMESLVRTAIGPFHLSTALDPKTLTLESLSRVLQDPLVAVPGVPQVRVTAEDITLLEYGQFPKAQSDWPNVEELVAVGPTGHAAAILYRRSDGHWQPTINFVGKS
jgi:tRNA pseudouridine55 synthase